MNEIKIDGTIVGEVWTGTAPDGEPSASANLSFDKKNDCVIVFCYGDRAMLLAKVKQGQAVRVSGRLTIHSKNRRAAILVKELETNDAEDRDVKEWNAARRHQDNARVKDNRWATRAGYVK